MASYDTISKGSPMFKALEDYVQETMGCSVEVLKQDSGCGDGEYNAVINKDEGTVEFESISNSKVHVQPHTEIKKSNFW